MWWADPDQIQYEISIYRKTFGQTGIQPKKLKPATTSPEWLETTAKHVDPPTMLLPWTEKRHQPWLSLRQILAAKKSHVTLPTFIAIYTIDLTGLMLHDELNATYHEQKTKRIIWLARVVHTDSHEETTGLIDKLL